MHQYKNGFPVRSPSVRHRTPAARYRADEDSRRRTAARGDDVEYRSRRRALGAWRLRFNPAERDVGAVIGEDRSGPAERAGTFYYGLVRRAGKIAKYQP